MVDSANDGDPTLAEPRRARMPPSFACTFAGCKAVFARDEHLTRHERTHSQERPFHCTLGNCDKWFSRLDNVRQHVRIKHSAEADEGERMLQEMSTLRKRLSVEATTRRRSTIPVGQGEGTSSAVARSTKPLNSVRDQDGRFAPMEPVMARFPSVLPVTNAIQPLALPPLVDPPRYALPVPIPSASPQPFKSSLDSSPPPSYAMPPPPGAQYSFGAPYTQYGELYRVELPPISAFAVSKGDDEQA